MIVNIVYVQMRFTFYHDIYMLLKKFYHTFIEASLIASIYEDFLSTTENELSQIAFCFLA